MDKVTFYGHAALGIETSGNTLLVDPFFSGNPNAAVSPVEVPADFILLTHGHGDHVGDAEGIARRTGALIISNSEIAAWYKKKGLKTQGQPLGGHFSYPFGDLQLTFALHGSTLPDGTYGGSPTGLRIDTKAGSRIYLAGDTGLFGDMQLIGEDSIDLAVLPIGGHFTMDPNDALRAVKMIRPRHVIPIHYHTWESIEQDPQAWAQRVEADTDTKVHVLQPGESFILP
jgi:L-ascorbate metabolism protein UlaG (beta-lactamase superfamily)